MMHAIYRCCRPAGVAMTTMLVAAVLSVLPCSAAEATAAGAGESSAPTRGDALSWHGEYREAMDEARSAGRMLLIWFHPQKQEAADRDFEAVLAADAQIRPLLDNYIVAKLPLSTAIGVEGQPVKLIEHPAFAEMLGRPGLAIVDQRDPTSPHFGRVVSIYPFVRGPIETSRLAVLLDLPTGTLTQRTMIFAVRTHPERPASAWSETSSLLLDETAKHARHQASIRLQGHHNWSTRFHQINGRLPSNLVANEVCAESWPGQTLVVAAEECVDCWRQSSGHWDHVRRRHAQFGYDMQRGQNGIWYAAGIFASER